MSQRIFVVEVNEDQSSQAMAEFLGMQERGIVIDWGCTVPVSLADDDVDAIADEYAEATEQTDLPHNTKWGPLD